MGLVMGTCIGMAKEFTDTSPDGEDVDATMLGSAAAGAIIIVFDL